MAIRTGGIVPRQDIALTVMEEMPDVMNMFVAHRVFPIFDVAVSTGPIPKLLRRTTVERLYRPKHGPYPRGQLVVDLAGTFDCKDAGFDEAMDEKDKEILGGAEGDDRALMIASIKAIQTLFLARDNALAASLMTTTTFGSGYNTAGAGIWGGASDAPITDITSAAENVRKRCGKRANKLLISGGLYTKLLQSPDVQSALRSLLGYTQRDGFAFEPTNKDLARLLGLDTYGDGEVIIGDAVKNTADEGQTASLSSVWDDTKALVFYSGKPGDLVSPSLGRTFVWTKPKNTIAMANRASTVDAALGLIVEQVMDPVNGIEIARAREFLDMLLLNKEAGHLVTGI